jgi:hypothetical protein
MYRCGMINAYRILDRNPKGKRPLGRSSCKEGDNIQMDFKEIGWESEDRIHLAQNSN